MLRGNFHTKSTPGHGRGGAGRRWSDVSAGDGAGN